MNFIQIEEHHLVFVKFLPKHLPLKSRIIPLSYHCSTTDPTAYGEEILIILLKVSISLLFHEPKVANLSILANENSHQASQRNF